MTVSPQWRVAAAAWAAAIFVSGVIPTRSMVRAISDGHETLSTTVAHFVAYALLGFLLAVSVGGWKASVAHLALGFALAVALGGVVEVLQGPLSYRDAQVVDFLVDAAGAAVGLVVFSVVASASRPRSRPG